MTEDEYYYSILGPDIIEPPEVGMVTPKVQHVKEGNPRARQEGYPRYRDEVDYSPDMDEDWSEHDE